MRFDLFADLFVESKVRFAEGHVFDIWNEVEVKIFNPGPGQPFFLNTTRPHRIGCDHALDLSFEQHLHDPTNAFDPLGHAPESVELLVVEIDKPFPEHPALFFIALAEKAHEKVGVGSRPVVLRQCLGCREELFPENIGRHDIRERPRNAGKVRLKKGVLVKQDEGVVQIEKDGFQHSGVSMLWGFEGRRKLTFGKEGDKRLFQEDGVFNLPVLPFVQRPPDEHAGNEILDHIIVIGLAFRESDRDFGTSEGHVIVAGRDAEEEEVWHEAKAFRQPEPSLPQFPGNTAGADLW